MQFHFSRYDLHDIVAVFSLWHMGCDETWLDGCTGYMSIIMVIIMVLTLNHHHDHQEHHYHQVQQLLRPCICFCHLQQF